MSKPLLFITGFLGAGKTTLLRALLDEDRKGGRSADVILNDFENAELDRRPCRRALPRLLRSRRAVPVVTVSKG